MSRTVTQWQIVTPDPEAHARFYQEAFGWSLDADNALGYRQVRTEDESEPGGGFWPAPPEARAFVQIFVAVEDLESSFSRALELGATQIVPPQVLPDGDRMAILHDPQGLAFGLHQQA